MFDKRKLIIILSLLILVSAGYFFTPQVINYFKWQQAVEAASAMPWQDGGTITMVREPCVLDTPATSPVTCGISCPLVSSVYGSACTGYIEIDVQSQFGTTFLAVPVSFQYRGGGTHPRAGTQYISGGASNAMPWVIGIPR